MGTLRILGEDGHCSVLKTRLVYRGFRSFGFVSHSQHVFIFLVWCPDNAGILGIIESATFLLAGREDTRDNILVKKTIRWFGFDVEWSIEFKLDLVSSKELVPHRGIPL